jgi:hypothetical protein
MLKSQRTNKPKPAALGYGVVLELALVGFLDEESRGRESPKIPAKPGG